MESSLLHIIVSMPFFRPHEYLDPGTGSFLVQLLIGGLVAVGFGVRMFWGRIKKVFIRKDASDAPTAAELTTDSSKNDDITQ